MAENNVTQGAVEGAAEQNPAQNLPGQQNTQEPAAPPQVPPKTFTEKEFQSEVDRRVTQALEGFKTEQVPILLKQAQQEAEKLATMNAEQKAQYEREQQETEYKTRLAELNKRELRMEAHSILEERGLPSALLSMLPFESAEGVKSAIDNTEKVFRSAVEAAVNERIKSPAPKAGGAPGVTKTGREGYLAALAKAHADKNNVAAISIKQEAARNGIYLD